MWYITRFFCLPYRDPFKDMYDAIWPDCSDGPIVERYLEESTCCLFPIHNLESMATTGEKVSAVKLPADWNSFFQGKDAHFQKYGHQTKKRQFNKENAKFQIKDSLFMHRIFIMLLNWLKDKLYERVMWSQQCWRSSFSATLKYSRSAMESNIFYDDIQLKSAAPSNSSFSHSLYRGLDKNRTTLHTKLHPSPGNDRIKLKTAKGEKPHSYRLIMCYLMRGTIAYIYHTFCKLLVILQRENTNFAGGHFYLICLAELFGLVQKLCFNILNICTYMQNDGSNEFCPFVLTVFSQGFVGEKYI